MEVLHGNETGAKPSRRQSDRYAIAENRLLDWAEHHSDIKLLPHSALTLAEVLSRKDGVFDLTPRAVANEANIKQLHSEANQHVTDQRCRLLTAHAETELLRLCKQILVENALIKVKGERQLYLAAGFISWSDASNPGQRHKAPLLLFPALLVRVPDAQRYEIRLAGEDPDFNSALHKHIEQRYELSLPEYGADMSLVDFFTRTAASLSDVAALDLNLEIALGSAAFVNTVDSQPAVALPQIPTHFDMALAMSITGNKRLEHLTAVLQLIPDFYHTDDQSGDGDEPSFGTATDPAANTTAILRRYAAKLATEGLDHVEFRQLPSLPALIAKWTDQVAKAAGTQTLQSVLNVQSLSARELIKIAGIIELIDKAPNNIETRAHGDLCFASSTILLRRAQHQAKLIEDELAALQQYFHLDRVPVKSQLLNIVSELGGVAAQEPDLIGADYFNARRQFMEFSKDKPANLTVEHRRNLSQLAKVMRFRELYVNNVEYRCALGLDYKGLRTNWPALIQTSDYARELADVLGSEAMAASIINNWLAFRDSFARELDTLQQGAEATRRLLRVVGKRWQTQQVPSLSAHAQFIAERVTEWNEQYGSVGSHADKTAAMVLSSFSGPDMNHVLIETHADETQHRIKQQLADGEINLEQIEDTLAWLLSASAAASEQDLGIDAIVEHLKTA